MKFQFRTFALTLLATAVAAGAPAQADEIADFYKDKKITAISGGGAGGGFSFAARLLGRHIEKYIPGDPTWVVTAMPGAGGARSVKYIVNAAAQDGTVVGVVLPPSIISPMLRSGVGYDSTKLRWIGSITPMASVLSVWHDSPAKTIKQLKTTEITTATSSKLSSGYLFPAWINHVQGTKWKIISGYRGGDRQNNAMQKGEVNGRSSFYASYKTTKPHWLRDKKIVHVVYMGPREKELDDTGVPHAEDLMKTYEQKQVLNFLQTGGKVGHGFFVSPSVPMARVEALRAAFDKAVADPAFLAEAKKRNQVVNPVKGAALDRIVADGLSTDKEVVARFKKAIKLGKGEAPKKK
jgi:tripartite-type tricarboxylate transporter receptor subunit TctC